MRRGIIFLIISVFLIIVSAPPLYLMGQEVLYEQAVNNQYRIENIYHPIDMTTDPFHQLLYLEEGSMKPFFEMKREIYLNGKEMSDYREFLREIKVSKENVLTRLMTFYHTEIAIIDTFTGTDDPEARERTDVQILIEGTNYAEPVDVEVRPDYLDNNRYHGYLGMLKMTDLSTKEENLVIIQRLFEDSFSISEKDFKWKVISVDKEGKVQTDIFTRENIHDPAFRRDLISKSTVSPYALGYKSNLLHSYPSLFYPFLYPFVSMGLGLILLVVGMINRRRTFKEKRYL